MFWGNSPALDLIKEYKKYYKIHSEINILIYGGVDARHILKTLSRLYKCNENFVLNIYVQEACLEQVARQLLLLTVAFDTNGYLGAASKTRTFMELYGNTLLRPIVSKYLTKKSEYLVNMVTDDIFTKRESAVPIVNLEKLKYIERDYLEKMFKYWADNDIEVNISQLWNNRIRKHLGVRYDNKLGVFDWDLHMGLHQVGAHQITIEEYKKWRDIGVAFTWTHSEPSISNRTLIASYDANIHQSHRGYLGDIVIGPYIAFGVHSDCKDLLKKNNYQNKFRATDVTEHNLHQIFHELFVGETYNFHLDQTSVVPEPIQLNKSKNIKAGIHLMSCMKTNETRRYHIIWLANFLFDQTPKIIANMASFDDCLVLIEGIKFNPNNRKEHFEHYNQRISSLASKTSNFKLQKFDSSKDAFATFIINK